MRLFDSHCHLDDSSYRADLADVEKKAHKAGVMKMLTVGTSFRSSEKAVRIAEAYEGIYASVGVHPHDVKNCSESILEKLSVLSENRKVKAWGEIGLDFNRMFSPKEDQEKWMIRQLRAAGEAGLPIIFHERDSEGRFFELIREHGPRPLRGVVHCFSGNSEELEQYLALGLYIGITGIVTIQSRGARLREQIPMIPADRILVETDAPYLTPTPERNRFRRNEPAFVRSVFTKVAEVRRENPEIFSETVWDNTCRLFGIP